MTTGSATEFSYRCRLCQHAESWTSSDACVLAAARHVFEEHGVGELPLEHPEDRGRLMQGWESQL